MDVEIKLMVLIVSGLIKIMTLIFRRENQVSLYLVF
jgi:hypothetical protein